MNQGFIPVIVVENHTKETFFKPHKVLDKKEDPLLLFIRQ